VEFDFEKSNILFKRMYSIFGQNSAESLHWKSAESQRLRYEIYYMMGSFENKSILDLGCGLGDLYGFLKQRVKKFEYLGVDILPEFVKGASNKFPGARFVKGDILTFKPEKTYDYVISCGALNVRIGNMDKLVKKAIKKIYSLCRIGCGFNLLSKNAYYKDDSLYNYDPVKIISHCTKYTPFIRYMHEYLDNDFTIFMYKDQVYKV